jgi:acyl transferase domain-containing protein/thioesterase domain-containing protein/acyl carrier protein
MSSSAIAIVGMAGRFPGARNVSEFWRNLRDGVESIRPLSDTQLLAAGVSAETLAQPEYVKAAAVLDGVDLFDASFFGLSARDAAIMDPQHRHFLESAWEALEDAGHPPERFDGAIGVFAGSGMNAYLIYNLLRNARLVESAGLFLLRQTGNDKDVLATRVSYQFDLRGPSLSVQTACSTSLVAVHLACQSLLGHECDMALAGGVTIEVPHGQGYLYRDGEILSRDGHCRAFDADSSGTIFSSGVGLVVLRRLEDALEDRDTIHAVILGSAINNDGQRKVGYLAPSVAGQAEVIAEALSVAGVSADQISYVETHGTGTTVGDPLEIKSLTQAFREQTQRKGFCAIASLKTNVGHLDAAAGVAGLIKVALALEHRQLPANLHFRSANPQIDFASSPFYVNRELADWPTNGEPRRAGVTSLGIGGTNAHVIVEEAPVRVPSEATRPFHLLTLSARSEAALDEAADRLARHLRDNPDLRLADVAFTCQVGRRAFPYRRTVVASNIQEAATRLGTRETRPGSARTAAIPSPSVVFLFPGQGAQSAGMAADLYANAPIFRDHFDQCAEQLPPHLGLDLREVVFARGDCVESAYAALNRTSITQPALFSIEYSLAQWWLQVGVRPHAMVGHSIGEYVAACLAGVLTLEDALALVAVRGRLMEECPAGAMLAVGLSAAELSLTDECSLAAVNGPQQCVVSGPTAAIEELQRQLDETGVACHRLPTSHAFHSALMDPILEPFREQLKSVALRPPQLPYLSNLSGTWITAAQSTDPDYWVAHLRNTVRFSDAASELLRQPGCVLIEVGPGRTLGSLVRQHVGANGASKSPIIVSSLSRRGESETDTAHLLDALGQVWVAGQTIDWSVIHADASVQRIPLPTYPFQRQRFWIEPDESPQTRVPQTRAPQAKSGTAILGGPAEAPSTAVQQDEVVDPRDEDRWFYRRAWRSEPRPASQPLTPTGWMIFKDPAGLGEQLQLRLRSAGHEVVQVLPGESFKRCGGGCYTIRPGLRADYDALLADLAERELLPQKVVHLWSVRPNASQDNLELISDLTFYSLLFLAQALGENNPTEVDLAIVTNRMQSIAGEPIEDPRSALVLGPARVIPKELPGIICRSLDIDLAAQSRAAWAEQIVAEQSAPFGESIVALRGSERWVETIEPTDPGSWPIRRRLRNNGVYLITGGLGGLGLVIAEELARRVQARLVLVARTPFPAAAEWRNALQAPETPENVRQQLRKLIEIESLGAEAIVLAADVCRLDQIRHVVQTAQQRFGSIHGVIHAAGAIEDGPLLVKSRESAARVLGPKLCGTLVLDEAVHEVQDGTTPERTLDFSVLFSSISSIEAPAGQIDYVAANAFLDAYAHSRRDQNVFAINWGPWREVGMAAGTPVAHPLLGRRLVESADQVVYSVPLNSDRHWMLTDHCLKSGQAVVPGTGYLEMASAALTNGSFDQGVEFEDVFFVAPLLAERGRDKDARVVLKKGANGECQFSVRSLEKGWIEHATGRIVRRNGTVPDSPGRDNDRVPANRSLAQIAARCGTRVLTFDAERRTEQERFLDFGPRWRCLKSLALGDNEALAELELSPQLADDPTGYRLHPGLLDLATGAALYLIDGYGPASPLYFPIAYKRAVVYRPLPAEFFSHIRARQHQEAEREVSTFDVTLLDREGRVLVDIEGFSMRALRGEGKTLASDRAPASTSENGNSRAEESASRTIGPAEGARAFVRILEADAPAGVFVLPEGPRALTSRRPAPRESVPATGAAKESVEAVLAEWWQELLGVERVHLDDDFFELGGQSLIVVRLFSKIKKTYGVNFGLSTLFEARTVRTLGRLIREARTKTQAEPAQGKSLVAIQPKGARLPLFVISGLGGNVIKYHSMAKYLGEEQPLYGLLPRGLDGDEPFHTRVEDMAEYYVETVLKVQPEGPYRLAGYSFGGAVAFEMAQQLVARGKTVSLLGMFDTIEWQYWERVGRSYGLLKRLAHYRALFSDAVADGKFTPLWKRFEVKSRRLVSRLFSPAPAPVPAASAKIEEANFEAAASYRARVYPGRMILFRATMRTPTFGDDEYLGWGPLVAGGIDIQHIPAMHSTILEEPAIQGLSEKLRECLRRDPPPTKSWRAAE